MCTEDELHDHGEYALSRRTFGAAAAAAGLIGATSAHAANVVEKDVTVKTADGVSDAALFYPEGKGPWPAVLVWPDIMGLRPAFRDMGRRLAAEGYVVLVPNPFYRDRKATDIAGKIDFMKPEERQVLMGMAGNVTKAASAVSDGTAYIAFLDAQPQVDKKKGVGVQGYCMGGPLTVRTAAAVNGRVRAGASFHGGGLTTDTPDSPHLLAPKLKGGYLFAVAKNDDAKDPESKVKLKAALDAAKVPATVEVYGGDHGWTVPGGAVYNQAEAERAWAALLALYKKQLA